MPYLPQRNSSFDVTLPQLQNAALSWLLVPALYCLVSLSLRRFDYNLFHVVVEFGSIITGVMALLVANISRRFSSSPTLLIASVGLGWCAALDFMHTLSYEGMSLIPGSSADKSIQFWLVGRMLQALVLLAAVLLLKRKIPFWLVHAACGLFVLVCVGLIQSGRFPTAFIPGKGLTEFKIVSEYLIIATLVAAAVQVQRERSSFNTGKYLGLQLALGTMILSEFCFTLYQDVFDHFNAAGHLLKVFSYWFLFRALIEQTLLQPFRERSEVLQVLGERLKELRCLNEVARVGQQYEADSGAYLAAVVELLPPAMLHEQEARASVVSVIGNFGVDAADLPEERSITVPLQVDGLRVGLLKVGYPREIRQPGPLFLDEEQTLMELVGQRVSAVLERKLNQDTIGQLNRLYRMLSGVNRAVVRSSSQSKLMWEIFTILRDSQGFSFIGLAERAGTQDGFTFTHAHSLDDADLALIGNELQALVTRLWANNIARQRLPVTLKVEQVTELHLLDVMKRSGSHELALVPVSVHGELLGLVLVAAPAGMEFPADQEKLLAELGEDVSFALSHLRQGQRLLEAEEQAEDSERRYEVLFNQSPVPMVLLDAGARSIIAKNLAYEMWLGSPFADISDVDEWLRVVIAEPERIEILQRQLLDNIGKDFTPFGFFQFPETAIYDSSGERRVVTGRLTVVEERILFVFNDITQLKEKERNLGESEARFRNMIEETLVAVMVVQEGRFVYVNQAFCRLTGWIRQDLINCELVTFARVMASDEAGFAQMETSPDPRRQKLYDFRHKDGRSIKLHAATGSMPWGGGLAEVMIVQDITEKLRYEQQLLESTSLLNNLAQQVPGVIYQYRLYPDGHASFPFATSNIEDIYEVRPEDVKDDATPVFLRLHPDDLDRVFSSITQSARDMSLWVCDYRVVLPSKGVCWRSGTARPQKLDDGSVLWHGFIEDATARKELEEELQRSNKMLQRSVSGTLDIISRIMDQRDPYTASHQHRVGKIAKLIGGELGLSKAALEMLELTGIVHDIGKIAVPTEILTKPTHLSEIELQIVRGHASAGYEMLKDTDLPLVIINAIHQHHERLDGSGYPQGLKGDEITQEARIIAVSDVLESMSSHRPYRPSLGIAKAVQELERGRGISYDAAVVDAALRIVRDNRLPAESTVH